VVGLDGAILHRAVVRSASVAAEAASLAERFAPRQVVMGDGTWARQLRGDVQKAVAPRDVQLVNEKHTTERARGEYWKAYPPRGLARLIPLGLRVPPQPIDDFAAVVIARDFLMRP
jgi:hypothetical protein